MNSHGSSSAFVSHPEIALQAAALDYVGRGWALTWFDYGQKFPTHDGWNTPGSVVTDAPTARQRWNGTPRNMGVVHGLGAVKTCSLDVDQVDYTRAVLAEFGIDLDALRPGVPCVIGNPENFRLLYQQPPGLDLPLKKLEWPDPNHPGKKLTVFELRAGANQDVLPPSLHPNGQPYRWAQPLPEDAADHPQPPAALLELWLNWAAWEAELKAACPWAQSADPHTATHRKADGARLDVIGPFNAAHDVRKLLEAHKYQKRGPRRYLPPNSTSGVPSVRILDSGKVFSSNGSCPLNDGHAHDAFSVFCILEHGGNVKAAIKAAAEVLGIPLAPSETTKSKPSAGAQPTAGAELPPDRAFDRHHPALMRKSGSSELLKNHYNAVTIVENAYPGLVGYNEFRQRIEARIPSPWRQTPGQWTEADTGELAFHVAKEFASFTLDALSAAVMTVAHRNKFNPAQERLRALAEQWDGSRRLEQWLVEYLGAAVNNSNSAYLAEIGSAWMKGVAARVLFPGCKRDDVLILRGDQGFLKSTAAQCIADAIHPDAFTDSLGNLDSKDSKAAIRGIIIAELGELSVLNKSDLESIKVYVATRADHFREAYGRGERDYPRTVSFIGTTNHPTFLKDPTGNRRFWPVTIPAPINIERFKEILPQLLGEAARRVLDGDPWYVNDRTALDQAALVRAAHFQDDVWTEAALNAAHLLLSPNCTLAGANSEFVTVAAILNAMGVRIEQQTVTAQTRIGGILRVAGWRDRKKRVGERKDNRTVWAWFPPVVPPESRFPLLVPPSTSSQIAAVPPVPPGSPYLGVLAKMDEGGNQQQEISSSETPLPAPHFYPLYESRGQPGEPGEPLGKQRLPVVPPTGSPYLEGEPKEPADALLSHHPAKPALPASPPADAKPGIAPRPTRCEWDKWNDRLVVKCPNPSPTEDRSGCAHCGAVKPVGVEVRS